MIRLGTSFLTRPLAHRGLHDREYGRVENAPLSFSAAVEHGYGIELDVQLSKDGVAMVFHDYDLRRLTLETGAVALRTATELQAIQLKNTTDHIPTLSKVLDLIDGQVPVVVEIKDQDGGMGSNVGPLEQAVAQDLANYSGEAAVMSFNPFAMEEIARLVDDRPLGLVTDRFEKDDWPTVSKQRCEELALIPDYGKLPLSFISHNQSQLDDVPVARTKSEGATILCWTVRSKENEAQARKVADNITFEGYLA